MNIKDWRQSLQTPPTYRLGNRTFRLNYHIFILFLGLSSLVLVYYYVKPLRISPKALTSHPEIIYNATYPLSSPVIINGLRVHKIGIVADLDTNSNIKNEPNTWHSFYMKGFITYNQAKETVSVSWESGLPLNLISNFAFKNRSMELSELVVFNGKLLTFDDRTGIIYEIKDNKVLPWVILTDGDGTTNKGFKSEWATVKDKNLYVGSMGKEWTNSQGEFENEYPMFVKVVDAIGQIRHINWTKNFKKIRKAIGITWPGYVIHESAMWSEKKKAWFFLPRRCSKERYSETTDEFMGCNFLIKADENFNEINTIRIGDLIPTHGYSSFKFIPDTDDNIILALISEEIKGQTKTYISAFDTNGKILMKEQKIPSEYKYEGLEFT